jgi:hypothetical protein
MKRELVPAALDVKSILDLKNFSTLSDTGYTTGDHIFQFNCRLNQFQEIIQLLLGRVYREFFDNTLSLSSPFGSFNQLFQLFGKDDMAHPRFGCRYCIDVA